MHDRTTIDITFGKRDGAIMEPFVDQWAEFEARRLAAGVTYRDICLHAGIQPANLSRYKNRGAEPTITQWVRIQGALNAIIRERATKLQRLA